MANFMSGKENLVSECKEAFKESCHKRQRVKHEGAPSGPIQDTLRIKVITLLG